MTGTAPFDAVTRWNPLRSNFLPELDPNCTAQPEGIGS
jgi:hypothetical protein